MYLYQNTNFLSLDFLIKIFFPISRKYTCFLFTFWLNLWLLNLSAPLGNLRVEII